MFSEYKTKDATLTVRQLDVSLFGAVKVFNDGKEERFYQVATANTEVMANALLEDYAAKKRLKWIGSSSDIRAINKCEPKPLIQPLKEALELAEGKPKIKEILLKIAELPTAGQQLAALESVQTSVDVLLATRAPDGKLPMPGINNPMKQQDITGTQTLHETPPLEVMEAADVYLKKKLAMSFAKSNLEAAESSLIRAMNKYGMTQLTLNDEMNIKKRVLIVHKDEEKIKVEKAGD